MLIRLISEQALYVQRSAEFSILLERVIYLLSFTRHVYFIGSFFFKSDFVTRSSFFLPFIRGDWKVERYFFSTLYTILILTAVYALVFADYHLSDNKKKIGQQCKLGLKNSWKMCVNFAWWLEILMLEI